jgi:hypothetical protein
MLASQLRWSMLNGPWIRRLLRNRSQSESVRKLRAAIWWILMRPKGHRHIVAPAGQHDVTAPSAAWLAGARPGITGIQVIVPAETPAPAEALTPADVLASAEALVPAEALAPAEASVQAEVPVQAGSPAEAASGDSRA